jgi:ATP-dependent RNA helicase RhlE
VLKILINFNIEVPVETTLSFDELNLNQKLLSSLSAAGFEKTSPIQEQTIPLILEGKDIFAQARTGSGKTGAFAIPVIQQILENQSSDNLYLVLSPTRELAQQTFKTFEIFGKEIGIKSVSVIGGESYQKQKSTIDQNVHVVVGTPGRVCDLAKQKIIDFSKIKSIIFDEADRLFDMGFKKEIEFVLRKAPKERQLIMVSATTNMDVLQTAYKFHSHPEEINVSEDNILVDKIDHNLVMLTQEEKFPYLVNLLRQREDAYAIIFCNTQIKTHEVAEWLKAMGFKASPISGRLAQNKRTRLMEDFRSKKTTILVCTDVAARGLDIKNVNLVVNYDLPNEAANYVHRIGRTGRAGEDGYAVSLCAHEDCENIESIYTVIEDKIPRLHVEDEDFATDVCLMPKIDRRSLRLESDKPERPKRERNNRDRKDKKENKNNNRQTKQAKATNSKPAKKDKPKKESKKPMTFNVTSNTLQEAQNQAMQHFAIKDTKFLDHTVLSKGKKKFVIFGPQETTYEFKMKNPSEDLIKSFFVNFIDKMGLDVFVSTSSEDKTVRVEIKGEDIGLFLANRKQLAQSVETVARQFIQKSDDIPSETRLYVNAIGTNPKPQKTQTQANGNTIEEDEDNIGNTIEPRRNNNARNAKGRNDRRGRNTRGNNRVNNRGNGRNNQKSEEWLKKLALKLKDDAIASGKEQATKPLNPAERRIIHQTLQDSMQVSTSSIGEGRFKRVLISLDR